MIGGKIVSEGIYYQYQNDIQKILKERNEAEQRRDIYKYLSAFLIAILIVTIILNNIHND